MNLNRVESGNKLLLVISGPNLRMLEFRESVYKGVTIESITDLCETRAREYGYLVEHFVSDSEPEIVNRIHNAINDTFGMIINAGALTHYSYSISDAIKIFKGPKVELHLSNPQARDAFRHVSTISPVVDGSIAGFNLLGYELAIEAVAKIAEARDQR